MRNAAELSDRDVTALARLPSALMLIRMAELAAIDRVLLQADALPPGAMRSANLRRLQARRARLVRKIEAEGARRRRRG